MRHRTVSVLNDRTDPPGRCLRHHHQAVSRLSDDDAIAASIRTGIIPPHNITSSIKQKLDPSENTHIREQLADFNAFSQFMTPPNLPSRLDERLPRGELTELWARSDEFQVRRKGSDLDGGDEGTYRWVFWQDPVGVIRSAVPRKGNAIVKTERATRWRKLLQRWRNFSFYGRDAQRPWERHRYVNQLDPGFYRLHLDKHESGNESGLQQDSGIQNDEWLDAMDDAQAVCDEERLSHRYSVIGSGFKCLEEPKTITDPDVLSKMEKIRQEQNAKWMTAETQIAGNEPPFNSRDVFIDPQTLKSIDPLKKWSQDSHIACHSESLSTNDPKDVRCLDQNRQVLPRNESSHSDDQKELPGHVDGAIDENSGKAKTAQLDQLSKSSVNPRPRQKEATNHTSSAHLVKHLHYRSSKTFLGSFENGNCTMLRIQTIQALKLYCERDFMGFMKLIQQHKSIITLDIRNNLGRGMIFSAPMVRIALQNLVEDSLQEYIPMESLSYVRDIIFHYLANRNLRLGGTLSPRWTPMPIDTKDFNAMNYLSEEYCDGFFQECQDIIRCGYGNTVEERIKSGAAVTAVLYAACLAAMDSADTDNATYAQNLVRSVGVLSTVAGALVMIAPISQALSINYSLIKPLSAEIANKLESRYTSGALRRCVVSTFRDTYVVGALRGERIPGMATRYEGDVSKLGMDEAAGFERLMERRRVLGKKFVELIRMYVNALGEQWPNVNIPNEEADATAGD